MCGVRNKASGGALTRKRMETIDDDFVAAATDFIKRTRRISDRHVRFQLPKTFDQHQVRVQAYTVGEENGSVVGRDVDVADQLIRA